MNRETLLRKIKEAAKQDRKKRQDPRFLATMGFLVAKGFLHTNQDLPLLPNRRLRVEDVVWAGQQVEPRILEVLPAALLRLGKHFEDQPGAHAELWRVVEQLRRREAKGDGFLGIPYEKLKTWANSPLRDKRVKRVADKKIVKTFRLAPQALDRLRIAAHRRGCTQTEMLEEILLEKV